MSNRRKVLAIEEDEVSRRVLARALERAGYSALEARDGAEGLALFERHRPGIVVAGWAPPEVDGPEVCRRIRALADRRHVYLILLTARAGRDDVLGALAAGADEFLTRPLDLGELSARLADAERVLALERTLSDRVTELEDALRHLRDTEARLGAAQRLAATAAVGVAVRHEVLNPLTGILGLVDLCLIEQSALPAGVAEALQSIGGLARRITTIVKRIEDAHAIRTHPYVPGAAALDLGAQRK